MQFNQNKASVFISIGLACLTTGCHTPNWYAYHSLWKVPCTADESGRSYFEKQSVGNATESPRVRSSSPPVDSSPAEVPRKDQTEPPDRASISAAPDIQLASHIQAEAPRKPLQEKSPLNLPEDLPGADTPPITLPRRDAQDRPLDPSKQKENILRLYTELTELPLEPDALPDASNGLFSLEELHRIARENHPGLRAAAASVEAARGLMIQAGLPPNPNIGYGQYTIKYADGTTREFYQIGLSANTTGISVYILGISDKTYLAKNYGEKIGKANVSGYCIKFKTLKDVNIKVLASALRYGVKTTAP